MPNLQIQTGDFTHTFPLPTAPGWVTTWSPSDDSLDVWIAIQQVPGGWVAECEIGNVSFVVGDASKTKPRIEVPVEVSVENSMDVGTPIYMAHVAVRPYPSDWPIGRSTWRRIAINSSFADSNWPAFRDNWRQLATSFGPCDLPIPTQGGGQRAIIVNQDAASLRNVYASLRAGTPFRIEDTSDGVILPMLGYMPMGPWDPGEVGGTGVYFMTGWRNNKSDMRRAYLMAPCEHEREKHYYRRDTGTPISTEDYPGITPDYWSMGTIPEAAIPDSGGDPLPQPYDFAHKIRGYRRTMQVAEQTDSPMAFRSLASLVGNERLRFSHRGRPAQPGYIPMNLRVLMDAAKADPSGGIFGSIAGRQIAWTFYALAGLAKLSGWTTEENIQANFFLDFIETATTPTGPIQKCMGGSGGWPQTAYAEQTFEQVILCYAVAAVAIQIVRPVPVFVHRVLENIYGPNTLLPILPYGGTQQGPPHYVRSAQDDGTPVTRLADPLSTYGDPAHAEAACGLAASLPGELNPSAWLDRAAKYGHAFPDWASKQAWLTSPGNTELSWTAGLLGMAQKLQAQGTDG